MLTKFGDSESKVPIECRRIQLNIIAECSLRQRAEPFIHPVPRNEVQGNFWVANAYLCRYRNRGQIVEQETFLFVQRFS